MAYDLAKQMEKSWDEFLDLVERIKSYCDDDDTNLPPLIFRGHSDCSWRLESTLERQGIKQMAFWEYYSAVRKACPMIEAFSQSPSIIKSFNEITWPTISQYNEFQPGTMSSLRTDGLPSLELLAYLRHHGFPSPLLDWTKSPYVAAFFACQKPSDKSPAIYLFKDRHRTPSSSNCSIYQIRSNGMTARRHYMQQSCYTFAAGFQADRWRFLPHEFVDNTFDDGDIFLKITLKDINRRKMLDKLNDMNINAFTLYGSEESLMETASREIFSTPDAS